MELHAKSTKLWCPRCKTRTFQSVVADVGSICDRCGLLVRPEVSRVLLGNKATPGAQSSA